MDANDFHRNLAITFSVIMLAVRQITANT